jgi:hypothetical protein
MVSARLSGRYASFGDTERTLVISTTRERNWMMSGKDDIMPIEVPTDEELFESTDDKAVDEPEAEEAEKSAEAEDSEAKSEPVEKEEKADHRVPLKELLDEREKRQQMQAQFEAMQQQMAYAEQQAQQQQGQQEWPDIFEHPEYYQQQIAYMQQMPQVIQAEMQQQVNQQLAMARMELLGELSLRSAQHSDPETYEKAWGELERRVTSGDNAWRQQVLSSQDPGKTLLELYKSNNVASTVGDDPEAYFQKRIEELRQDPQALAQLLGTPSGGSQAPRVNLPPSLTKAGASAGSLPQISGRDLWDNINS